VCVARDVVGAMREYVETFMAMFSFLGVLALMLFPGIWMPTVDRWAGQDIQVEQKCGAPLQIVDIREQ
jgi:hypothetical protein